MSKRQYLLIITFITGMATLAMELTAARLLAPYFGTSLLVWSSVIGVILAALAVGYYYGGKMADRNPDLRSLLKIILSAGLIFVVIPWIAKPILMLLAGNIWQEANPKLIILVGSLVVMLILFAIPIAFLGMVSPYIIKLYMVFDGGENKTDLGNNTGIILAASTIGSLIGTFLPTLWLIPMFGTRMTMIILAAVLILLASLGLWQYRLVPMAGIVVLIASGAMMEGSLKDVPGQVQAAESEYQYIQVLEDEDNWRYLVFNEGLGIQSVYNPDRVLGKQLYYDYYNVLPLIRPSSASQDVLILGLAGGTISRQLNYFYGDHLQIDGVELDPAVIAMAQEYFELDQSNLTVYNNDARLFLKHTDKKYDYIIVDAYAQMYIPWTLTTREWWQEVATHLKPGGIVAMNINSITADSDLLVAMSNTLASVFANSYTIHLPGQGEYNYMLWGSQASLDFNLLREVIEPAELQSYAQIIAQYIKAIDFHENQPILTDDKAPVEMLTEQMIWNYILDIKSLDKPGI